MTRIRIERRQSVFGAYCSVLSKRILVYIYSIYLGFDFGFLPAGHVSLAAYLKVLTVYSHDNRAGRLTATGDVRELGVGNPEARSIAMCYTLLVRILTGRSDGVMMSTLGNI